VVVVPAPASPVTPPATPPATTPATPPIAAPAPGAQALACTVQDTVQRAASLVIRPVAGNVAVVAIGSSSTAGAYASSPASTYPAVLQQLLSAYPGIAAYAVVNKGLNGDTLSGTQARLERDALNLRPQLVILQAGTNDAVNAQNAGSLADYTARLRTVVATLKGQTAVVLMNGQHYASEPAVYGDYLNAMATVAREQDVALFDRYALMKSWIVSGKYRYADILASDGYHPNDMTYRCMAQVVAQLTVGATVR
jgi:lysophospholipase L1-like esterase